MIPADSAARPNKSAVDQDLRAAQTEHQPLGRQQARQRKLQADGEHQQDHAQLGKQACGRAVHQPSQRRRPDQDTRDEVADDRREPEALAQRDEQGAHAQYGHQLQGDRMLHLGESIEPFRAQSGIKTGRVPALPRYPRSGAAHPLRGYAVDCRSNGRPMADQYRG
jgi:hypothetical protein